MSFFPDHYACKEVRGIFVIKAAVEMQNNLPFCDLWRALACIFPVKSAIF
jgi:hypothetical protein